MLQNGNEFLINLQNYIKITIVASVLLQQVILPFIEII